MIEEDKFTEGDITAMTLIQAYKKEFITKKMVKNYVRYLIDNKLLSKEIIDYFDEEVGFQMDIAS